MTDRPLHHTRWLTAATLLIEAFVVLHFLGVFSFMSPLLSLVAFALAGGAFYLVRRVDDANSHPNAS